MYLKYFLPKEEEREERNNDLKMKIIMIEEWLSFVRRIHSMNILEMINIIIY